MLPDPIPREHSPYCEATGPIVGEGFVASRIREFQNLHQNHHERRSHSPMTPCPVPAWLPIYERHTSPRAVYRRLVEADSQSLRSRRSKLSVQDYNAGRKTRETRRSRLSKHSSAHELRNSQDAIFRPRALRADLLTPAESETHIQDSKGQKQGEYGTFERVLRQRRSMAQRLSSLVDRNWEQGTKTADQDPNLQQASEIEHHSTVSPNRNRHITENSTSNTLGVDERKITQDTYQHELKGQSTELQDVSSLAHRDRDDDNEAPGTNGTHTNPSVPNLASQLHRLQSVAEGNQSQFLSGMQDQDLRDSNEGQPPHPGSDSLRMGRAADSRARYEARTRRDFEGRGLDSSFTADRALNANKSRFHAGTSGVSPPTLAETTSQNRDALRTTNPSQVLKADDLHKTVMNAERKQRKRDLGGHLSSHTTENSSKGRHRAWSFNHSEMRAQNENKRTQLRAKPLGQMIDRHLADWENLVKALKPGSTLDIQSHSESTESGPSLPRRKFSMRRSRHSSTSTQNSHRSSSSWLRRLPRHLQKAPEKEVPAESEFRRDDKILLNSHGREPKSGDPIDPDSQDETNVSYTGHDPVDRKVCDLKSSPFSQRLIVDKSSRSPLTTAFKAERCYPQTKR